MPPPPPPSHRPLHLVIALVVVVALVGVVGYCVGRPTTRAAGTSYVALTGSDSAAGTASAPWRYLSTAVSRLVPGDRLCVGAGTWSDTRDVIDSQRFTVPSGTDLASGAITIGACNGDVATLKPLPGSPGVKLTVGAPHHLVITDLQFDGSLQPQPTPPDSGAELLYTSSGAHHIRFQRVTVAHTMSHAVQFSMANSTADVHTAIEVLDSVFRDIGNATGDSGHGGPGVNNGYAIYAFTAGNRLHGNRFEDTRGTALVLYGPDNVVDGNRFTRIATRGASPYAVNIGSSAHPVPSTNNWFVNNQVDGSVGGGVQVYTSAEARVLNNTFVGTGQGPWAVHLQYCLGATVQNNIFQGYSRDVLNDSPESCVAVQDHNLPSTTDAKFLDATQEDFRLTAASPAFDTGVRIDQVTVDGLGVPRPQATTFDLGAHELVVEAPPAPEGKRAVLVAALSNVIVPVTSGPAVLHTLVCSNPNGERVFVQLFDQAGALRAGTDAPVWAPGVPAGATLPLTGLALGFTSSVRVAATRTPLGAVPPAVPVTCNFGVR